MFYIIKNKLADLLASFLQFNHSVDYSIVNFIRYNCQLIGKACQPKPRQFGCIETRSASIINYQLPLDSATLITIADGFKKPVRHSYLSNNAHNPFRKLHRHAMQTAVLMHQWPARYWDDFMLRKAFSQSLQSDFVHRITIRRHQYGMIDDQKVGVIGG